MTFDEWWIKEHPGAGADGDDYGLALEGWNAAIDAASELAELHGFESDVGPDPLACQGCAEEVAESIRKLKAG